MPYLTLRENLKRQLSPGLVAYTTSSQETECVYSGTNTHTRLHTYLLAPDPHGAFRLRHIPHRFVCDRVVCLIVLVFLRFCAFLSVAMVWLLVPVQLIAGKDTPAK